MTRLYDEEARFLVWLNLRDLTNLRDRQIVDDVYWHRADGDHFLGVQLRGRPASNHVSSCALTARDTRINAGITGRDGSPYPDAITVRAVRGRVEAWAAVGGYDVGWYCIWPRNGENPGGMFV